MEFQHYEKESWLKNRRKKELVLDKNTFWKKADQLTKLFAFEPCIVCGSNLLITQDIEPVDNAYYKSNRVQHCIVFCSMCKKEYRSNYDSYDK